MKNTKHSHDSTVRRAALPEVMLPEDLAESLGITTEQAEASAMAGLLGPKFMVSGRPAVLRKVFLEHLLLLSGPDVDLDVVPESAP